jgi:hypothetical protein
MLPFQAGRHPAADQTADKVDVLERGRVQQFE